MHELKGYGAALPHDERVIYGRLLKLPMKKIGAISYANSMHAWALMLMTIIIEQEKKIEELNARMADRRVQKRELNHPLAQENVCYSILPNQPHRLVKIIGEVNDQVLCINGSDRQRRFKCPTVGNCPSSHSKNHLIRLVITQNIDIIVQIFIHPDGRIKFLNINEANHRPFKPSIPRSFIK